MFWFLNLFGSPRIIPDYSGELRRANQLKELELKQKEENRKREEWLSGLKRMDNTSLLKQFNNTEEYLEYIDVISGGASSVALFESNKYRKQNKEYVDIKNECIIRGLI